MPFVGSLKDVSLSDLIRLNCQEMNEAKITVEYLGKEGVVFCSGGELIHAATGSLEGEEALYELLRWKAGSFSIQYGITLTDRTIERDWNSILQEGTLDFDTGEVSTAPTAAAEDKFSRLAHDLCQITTVTGAIIVARDGTVLAEMIEGNAENEGAIAGFLGNAADQIGEVMALGPFEWGTVALTSDRMLIVEKSDFYVGVHITEKASPMLVASDVKSALVALD